jgi:serine/threonine protein kinase
MSSEVQGPGVAQTEIAIGELSTISLVSRPSGFGGARRAIVKRLRAELAGREELAQLLVDERRFAAAIHHANVASLYTDGSDGSEPCFEYVDGEALEQLLSRSERNFKPRFMVPVFVDLLRGLGAVHAARDAQGVPLSLVHQAPHAHHIMVGTDGGSRLIDLSLARVANSPYVEARDTRLRPGYTAPEQVLDAGTVDHRADLFIVGIALWEALTGEHLFFADDSTDASRLNVLHRSVPKPSSVGRTPPGAFDAVCLRALERDPAKRFQTAAEMQAALAEAGRSAGGATAFEVGQWVMAVAGATLRARHSAPSGAFGAGGSVRPDPRFRTSPPPSGRPPSAFPPGQIRIARPSDSARPPPAGEHSPSTRPSASAASSAFGARGTGVRTAPPTEPLASSAAVVSPPPARSPAKATQRMDASAAPSAPPLPSAGPAPAAPAAQPAALVPSVPPLPDINAASAPSVLPQVAMPQASEAPPPSAAPAIAPRTPPAAQAFDAEEATSEMRRPSSDVPTEILSAEQTRELAVRTQALRGQTPTGPLDDDAEWQSLATTRAEGPEPYVGRVTQELFPIRRAASAGPPAASKPPIPAPASAWPAPMAPISDGRGSALAAPSEASPTGPARRRPESTRPPVAPEVVPRRSLRTPIAAPSSAEVAAFGQELPSMPLATPAEAHGGRPPMDAGSDALVRAERTDLAPPGEARSGPPSALVYVPRLDEDEVPSAAWGPDGAGAPTHSGGRDSITSRSPEGGGSWATLAVVAAVAVVAMALVFGANRQVSAPEPSLSSVVPSVTPMPSPTRVTSPVQPTVTQVPTPQAPSEPSVEPALAPPPPDARTEVEPPVAPPEPDLSSVKPAKPSAPAAREPRPVKEPTKQAASRLPEAPAAAEPSRDGEGEGERAAPPQKPSVSAADHAEPPAARAAATSKPAAADTAPPAEKLPINPY